MTAQCNDHAELTQRIARIEATTDQILLTMQRVEDRVYASHGDASQTAGSLTTALKVSGIAAAIGAAIATAINLVAG